MTSWKRDFASGLIVLAPFVVTVAFLAWIYSYLVSVPLPVESGPVRVALTLVIFVLLVFSVGYLMRTAVGAVLERALDDAMNHLPGLRIIYNASKMAVETALSGTGDFRQPVRLEVWDGLRMTAFKTGNQTDDGREVLFLPTAPNITTGYVIEVEQDRYTETDDTVEDALTRVLSAGFGDNENASVFGRPDNGSDVPVPGVEESVEAVTGTDTDQTDPAETPADPDSENVTADDGPTEPATDGGSS